MTKTKVNMSVRKSVLIFGVLPLFLGLPLVASAETNYECDVDCQKRAVENEKRAVENEKRAVENKKRAVENEKRAVENDKRIED